MQARSAVTVNADSATVYDRWRAFDELPRFMFHLESVRTTGGGRSHWVARGPAGTTVEWDAEMTDDVPGERISWRSVEGSDVSNRGTVTFRAAPANRGTEIHVELEYSPPGGALGAAVAKLFGEEPNQQLADDLRRFKQLVETGEIARSDAAPLGTRQQNQMHQLEGQPLSYTDTQAVRDADKEVEA